MTKNELKLIRKVTLLKALEEACLHIENGSDIFTPQHMINQVLGKSAPTDEDVQEPQTEVTLK